MECSSQGVQPQEDGSAQGLAESACLQADVCSHTYHPALRLSRGSVQALSTKIKLKNAAILALPEELRAHAATEDLEPPPLSRRMPTLTPPIPDYKQQQQTSTTPGRRIGTKR